jgi:two-component system, LytTR family, sensor kinase
VSAKSDDASGATARRPPWGLVWLFTIPFFSLATLLRFTYKFFDDVANAETGTFAQRVLEEVTGNLSSMLLFIAVVAYVWRFPLDRPGLRRRLPVHLLGMVAYSVLHTTFIWSSRNAVLAMAGMGPYNYGYMPARYLMEFGQDAISYMSFLAIIHLYRYYRTVRDRELHAERLERGLAQAQLQNLRLQLQPHFLFNALNTISSTVYEDARAADRLIGQLAELLRVSLRTSTHQEVPLGDELAVLDLYVALMRARFGARLTVRMEIDPALSHTPVPSLVLQPLVENAIRHGNVSRIGSGTIVVRAFRDADRLGLEVENDGVAAPSPRSDGLGIKLTRERLRLLYGDRSSFSAGPTPSGDRFLVAMRVPLQLSRVPTPPSESVPAVALAASSS